VAPPPQQGISPEALIALTNGSLLSEIQGAADQATAAVEEAGSLAQALKSKNREEIIVALRELRGSGDSWGDDLLALEELDRESVPQHKHFPLLIAAVRAGVPAMIHGEAGSGKSEASIQVSHLLDLDFHSLSLNPATSRTEFYGYKDASGNYHSTGFREVFEGGGVFLFDEMDNSHPSATTAINFALANGTNGGVNFPDGKVSLHKDARFIAAANTIGKGATAQYVGRSPIDAATRDRFVFIPWDIDEEFERSIVEPEYVANDTIDLTEGGVPQPGEWRETVVEYRRALGEVGIKQLCSPRSTIYGVKLAQAGVGMKWLKELCIYRGMPEHDREKVNRYVVEEAERREDEERRRRDFDDDDDFDDRDRY
jgi:cobaltochelatase CobS